MKPSGKFRPGLLAAIALLGAAGPARLPGADRPATAEPAIMLPPLEVVTTSAKSGRPWQYAAFPGGEVLSRTSASVTREFLEAQFRLQQVIAQILPEALQGRRSVPDRLILATSADGTNLSKDMVVSVTRESAAKAAAAASAPALDASAARRIQILDNLRLNDVDATVVYAVIDEFQFSGQTFHFTPDQLAFMMESRVPRLPEWFVVGLMTLFPEMRVEVDTLIVGNAGWAPQEVSENILRSADYAPPLLAMSDLFERPCPPAQGATLTAAQTWRAQAALFVHWMLSSEARRPKLWSLVARAAEAPLTDEICQRAVGLDYVDLRDRLSDYVRGAMIRGSFRLKVPQLARLPSVEIGEATPLQVARIKGDWERLVANWVRARQPGFLEQYVAQARRTLTQAYERGEREPDLRALLGLFECDLGNDAAARPHLEAAAAARVVRPRIYFELARLRYAVAMAQPLGGRNLLNSAQVNTVLEPFKVGYAQAPPLLESSRLLAEVWSHSTATLGPEQLALCDRAVALFPHDPGLLYNVTLLKVVHGQVADAIELARRGLATSDHPAARAQFTKLLARLAEGAESAATPR